MAHLVRWFTVPENPENRYFPKQIFRSILDGKSMTENEQIRPYRRCWGVIVRMALVKGYRFTWGGGIFRPKPPVFDRSWRSPSKNTVKNSTEDTCSWTRPSKIGKRKVKKPCVFQLFDLNFLVCNIFFCGSAGGLARRRIFEFLDPFSDWFSSFCDSRNTGFYSVFLFSACLTASFKTSKNLVNYAVLCYGVNENIVNTSVFWRWLKNTVNYSVFGHLTLKNHGICSGFCFSPRKTTVNNSNFAVFSCFSLFFELRWSAIHGYQILLCEPHDAVRAVAVAKRREYGFDGLKRFFNRLNWNVTSRNWDVTSKKDYII